MIYLFVFVVIILAAFIFFASKGVPRGLNELERPIKDLLERGFDGGTLVITHKNSKNFIQFRKYKKKAKQGIVFSFPLALWSEGYYSPIKKLAEDNGVNGKEKNFEMSFFEIDFREDYLSGYDFTKKAFLSVFGATATDKYYVSLQGASPR